MQARLVKLRETPRSALLIATWRPISARLSEHLSVVASELVKRTGKIGS
jgi:hypothetical protein